MRKEPAEGYLSAKLFLDARSSMHFILFNSFIRIFVHSLFKTGKTFLSLERHNLIRIFFFNFSQDMERLHLLGVRNG